MASMRTRWHAMPRMSRESPVKEKVQRPLGDHALTRGNMGRTTSIRAVFSGCRSHANVASAGSQIRDSSGGSK